MAYPKLWKTKKRNDMKTLRHILVLALLLCANLTSCTPDDSVTENESLHTEVLCSRGSQDLLEEDGDIN